MEENMNKNEKRQRILSLVLGILPFLSLDIWLRIWGHSVNYFRSEMVAANLCFTMIWIGLFSTLGLWLKGEIAKIIYCICFGINWILFLANAIYYSLTGYFMSVRVMSMAGEGKSYIGEVMKNTNPWIYVMAIVSLVLAVLAVHFMKGQEQFRPKRLSVIAVLFVGFHLLAPALMGSANGTLSWDTWRNPRDVYNNFIDTNKNMKICGLYEYTFRDVYKTLFGQKKAENPEDQAFLEDCYKEEKSHEENAYTGRYQGENVIFLQLEGMDTWMLTKEDTPNLYQLQQESIDFTEHYSYYNGGGSTFNSEFAINTGFLTPVSYAQNAYTLYGNTFPDTLPSLFQEQGYRSNAFHMNSKEYYSRGLNFESWGYEAYHSLLDSGDYKDKSYELDRELVENPKFYQELFQGKAPFLHYLITYTPHTPFTTTKGVGKQLTTVYGLDGDEDLGEEACARLMAKETDYMVGLLLQGLKDNDLYEDTVIVAYADHYLYTLNEKSILDQYKETDSNLINRTPFFIWSAGQKPESVGKVNSQLDILPTVLNLFGISYQEEIYLGQDIFDDRYDGLVFFSDYSWYDGKVYVVDGEVVKGSQNDTEEVHQKNEDIQDLIRRNDLTLQYDYFKNKKK